MKASASKICNKSNHTKISFNFEKTALTLPLVTMFNWINESMNESDALSLLYSVAKSKEGMAQKLLFPSTDCLTVSNQQHLIFRFIVPFFETITP